MRSRKRDRQKIWFSNVTEKKQQFGAVIEKGCPDEFVSDDGESINLYSMIATCIAAIQKQQEEIDILKKRRTVKCK